MLFSVLQNPVFLFFRKDFLLNVASCTDKAKCRASGFWLQGPQHRRPSCFAWLGPDPKTEALGPRSRGRLGLAASPIQAQTRA